MRKIKYFISIILTLILCFSLVECTDDNKENERAKGRYIEEDCKINDNLSTLYDIKQVKDKNIILVGADDKNNFHEYLSKDDGKTFERIPNRLSIFLSKKNYEILKLKIVDESIIYVAFLEHNDRYKELEDEGLEISDVKDKSYYEKLRVVKITNNTHCEDIHVSQNFLDCVYDLQMDDNGNIVYYNFYSGKIIYLDIHSESEIGEINKPEDGEDISSFYVLRNLIVVTTDKSIIFYKLDNLQKLYETKDLYDYINANDNIFQGDDDKSIYFYNNDGLYRYVFGGNMIEQVIDGSLSSFGNNSYQSYVIEKDKNEFLALFMHDNIAIKKYRYSKDELAVPRKKITVYSLKYDDYIKQVVYNYQRKNKNVYINYVTGTDDTTNNISLEEAVKSLKLDIMKGKGPDVIILDGFNSCDLKDKGKLADLSSVINKNNDLLKNVVDLYKSDNKIYSFPLSVSIPVIVGDKDAGNINALLSKLRDAEQNNEIPLSVSDPKMLINYLYYRCNYNWVNKDNVINNDNIKNFLINAKQIYDYSIKISSDFYSGDEGPSNELYNFYLRGDIATDERNRLKVYQVSHIFDLTILDNEYNKIDYSIWNQDGGVLTPYDEVSINNNSKEKKESRKFINYALNHMFTDSGFQISTNKKVNEKFLMSEDYDANNIEYIDDRGNTEYYYNKDIDIRDINSYNKMIEGLKNKSNLDIVSLNKVIDYMSDYVLGNKSLEETMEAIDQKMM